MGSEQSHNTGTHNRVSTASRSSRADEKAKAAAKSSSPRPSISSDSDIPYISYAVNRPIGDSPKLPSKSPVHNLTTATPSPRPSPKPRPRSYAGSTSSHDIVIVKEGVQDEDSIDMDPELMKLKTIPIFLPIMRGALNIPTVWDPDVLDKMDHQSMLLLCSRYQDHLRQCAEVVSTEQNTLAARIREIDFAVATLMGMLTERQKKFAKYAEQLSKIHEISSTLKNCQSFFVELEESMTTLNEMLPLEERLEPFVMVTG